MLDSCSVVNIPQHNMDTCMDTVRYGTGHIGSDLGNYSSTFFAGALAVDGSSLTRFCMSVFLNNTWSGQRPFASSTTKRPRSSTGVLIAGATIDNTDPKIVSSVRRGRLR